MRQKLLPVAFLALSVLAQGQDHFKVLHAFGSGTDGAGVYDSVSLDAHGNIYGTTSGGGAHKAGTVFRLAPGTQGAWKETILHTFPSSNEDGGAPFGGLLLAANGILYGTTESLGAHDRGVVFSLTASKHGWQEKIVHTFCSRQNCEDGGAPWGNLIMDPSGDLYGTGYVVFELLPGQKSWTDTTLHVFTGNYGDGSGPQAGPIRDAVGNLYGTTMHGGGSNECDDGCGTVWELEPPASDQPSGPTAWTEIILHRFGIVAGDGAFPGLGQLAVDREGNLYGTADSGGPYLAGIVFRLTRPSAGSSGVWKETILHGFAEDQNGYLPTGGVTFDSAGNLYGTTGVGGSQDCGCGVVFKLSPQADGSWKYAVLHTFVGSDGAEPVANLTFGPDGKLYGTTATGGTYGGGVVFQLTP